MSANAAAGSSRCAGIRIIPWIAGVAYFAIGLSILHVTHPEEDAFILFKYVQNLAAGQGIVFYPGGPHAEGATDFLWLLCVTALVRVGFDVAIAACALNALGAALASRLFVGAVERAGLRGRTALVWAVIPSVLLVGAPALGGYAGFSTMLYSALAASVFWMSVSDSSRVVASVPLGAIVLALFRPDGVVLGAALSVLSLVRARRLGSLPRWMLCGGAAFAIGASYLAWRASYFELPLPLPLYVKSNGVVPFSWSRAWNDPVHALPGLSQNLHWCVSALGPVPLLVAAAAIWFGATGVERAHLLRVGLSLTPVLVFLGVLACGRQTQNYAFRFQAPAMLILSLAMFRAGLPIVARASAAASRATVAAAALVLAQIPATVAGCVHLASLSSNRNYIDVFPRRLAEILGTRRVLAITEAGRLAYWTHSRVEDMVGLNNPHTAVEPPDAAYLRDVDPDIVMFHVADTFALPNSLSPQRVDVLPLTGETLASSVRERSKAIYEQDLDSYPAGFAPESVAPAVLGRFLVESGTFAIYAVRYRGGYDHVFGIRRDLPELAAVVNALTESTRAQDWRSYAELAGFWTARR